MLKRQIWGIFFGHFVLFFKAAAHERDILEVSDTVTVNLPAGCSESGAVNHKEANSNNKKLALYYKSLHYSWDK